MYVRITSKLLLFYIKFIEVHRMTPRPKKEDLKFLNVEIIINETIFLVFKEPLLGIALQN